MNFSEFVVYGSPGIFTGLATMYVCPACVGLGEKGVCYIQKRVIHSGAVWLVSEGCITMEPNGSKLSRFGLRFHFRNVYLKKFHRGFIRWRIYWAYYWRHGRWIIARGKMEQASIDMTNTKMLN